MNPRRVISSVLLSLALAAPAVADESGCFVIRLGQDTTSVECYTRSATRTEVRQVGRAPRVLRRNFTYEYDKGNITKFALEVTAPGATAPTQSLVATFGDSMRMETRSGTGEPQKRTLALPPGTLPVAQSSPWAQYERLLMTFVKSKADSLRTTMYLIGGDGSEWLSLHRLGRDSVSIFNQHRDQYHVRVDAQGRIQGVLPVAGTAKVRVERVTGLDVEVMAASFAAREQGGTGLGVLSPRDTVRVDNAGGASVWIDYGRPAKRGRVIMGQIVPYGEVWRTGANAATQIKTDKALVFGGKVVPAGFYTLWTIPGPTSWKLVVNSQTGQWGTVHDPALDLYTIDMAVSTLPQPAERFTISVDPSATGGTVNLDWDTTRASTTFTVQP